MTTQLSLRNASQNDSRLLWEWANDPIVRASAFNTEPIPWEDHENWFDKKLKDPNCFIYIAELSNEPIGQIRFNCDGQSANIDIHLAPEARGKGLGTNLLTSGIEKIFAESEINEIHSSVKVENAPSSKMFLKAGFSDLGKGIENEQEVYNYVLKKS
ncbi:MAG: GNAT family N-acetyltransferase [Candidatus Peribacteraceae bacterium]|jgi:RimJ/RimL family protein N-acetyltransferase|nr:GNAT family N-acetyltransferase [Candidatus Peribacteraceae bacterium]MDP7645813.1 GNAT family N-acetyltransferase [Candidatus Peribacteraceae bacterium]HCI03564.1 GNAT family N-acetyltransferase [Candidatus Peribacteria bacterium]|tara:strand:- start:104 stop:574 length:471 start_codon:yes stop_codon:yes gene_type:complete